MFASFANLWPLFWPFNHVIKINELEKHISAAHAEPWHLYAINKRYMRPHVCLACAWLAQSLPKSAAIFEAGCGSGINLLWLGRKGFTKISGADLSASAVALAKSLSKDLKIKMDVWQDNSLAPRRLPAKIDGLISLNWFYHLGNANLGDFFAAYRPFMAQGAKAVFDMVDASYNDFKNNNCHTDDIALPMAKRRPSEYPLRMSSAKVEEIAAAKGFRVLRQARVWGQVPRTVWLLEYAG